jgi:hypothetical protein
VTLLARINSACVDVRLPEQTGSCQCKNRCTGCLILLHNDPDVTWHVSSEHTLSVSLSAHITAAPIERIFVKFNIGDFCENLSRYSKFGYSRTQISGTLRKYLSVSILLAATYNIVHQ